MLSDVPLKIKMNEELRKTTNKNKIITIIKNGILNDFLSGMVEWYFEWFFEWHGS